MLGRSLRRPATFLRKVGIEIGFKREGSARKIIITRNPLADWVGEQPSQPSQPSQPEQGQSAGDDRGGDGGRASWAGDASPDHAPQDVDTCGDSPSSHMSPHLSRAKPLKSNGNDSSDSSDGKIPTQSGEDPICRRCGVPSSEMFGPLIPCGANGSAGLYHLRCWTEERTRAQRRHVSPDRRPALGPPPGDSLDDLQ
jgi:hypothetical protein